MVDFHYSDQMQLCHPLIIVFVETDVAGRLLPEPLRNFWQNHGISLNTMENTVQNAMYFSTPFCPIITDHRFLDFENIFNF